MGRSGHIPDRLRVLVAQRAHYGCEYCPLQEDLCPDSFEIDHIIPRAAGGRTKATNLCYSCAVCNNAKRSLILARDPQSGRRVRLFDPRRQSWSRHFQWGDDGSQILGTTTTGRATVVALDMNRPGIVHLRLLWVAMGLHPPRNLVMERER